MFGILKLGGVVFGAYVVGGKVGEAVSSGKSPDIVSGAKLTGRVLTFIALAYLARNI